MKTETFQLPWGDVQVVYPEAEGDEVLRALRVARLETEQGPVLVLVMAETLSQTPLAGNALRVMMKSTFDSLATQPGDSLPDWLNNAMGWANSLLFHANDLVNSEERVALVLVAISNGRAYLARAGDFVVEWVHADRHRLRLTRPRSRCPALGGSADLRADMGFYLEGDESGEEQSLRLGRAGLPLKSHEGLVLRWLDGSPALVLELSLGVTAVPAPPVVHESPVPREPARGSTQTVLYEVPRTPVSAPQPVFVASLATKPEPRRKLWRIALSALALVALLAVGAWGSGLLRGAAAPAGPTATQIVIARAAHATITPTTGVPTNTPVVHLARVAATVGGFEVECTLADGQTRLLTVGDVLSDGMILTSGQGSLRVEFPELGSIVILLPGSSAAFHLLDVAGVDLRQGGVWVGSDGQALEVRQSGKDGAARVLGGQMAVLLRDLNPMSVICFSGQCLFRASNSEYWRLVPAGEEEMHYFYKDNPVVAAQINQLCAGCLSDWVSTPTQALTRVTPMDTPTPVRQDNNEPAPTKTDTPPTATQAKKTTRPPVRPTEPTPTEPTPTEPPTIEPPGWPTPTPTWRPVTATPVPPTPTPVPPTETPYVPAP